MFAECTGGLAWLQADTFVYLNLTYHYKVFKVSLVIHRIKELCRWSLTINANITKFFYEKFFGSRLFSDGELVFSVVTANFGEDWSFRKGSETEMERQRSHSLNVEVTRMVSASLVTKTSQMCWLQHGGFSVWLNSKKGNAQTSGRNFKNPDDREILHKHIQSKDELNKQCFRGKRVQSGSRVCG